MSETQSKTWNSVYIGRSRNQEFTHEYRLKTAAVQSLDATSPFQYVIQPVALDIVKKPNTEYAEYVQSQQKVASADSYKPAYNRSQHSEPAYAASSSSFGDVMENDFTPLPGVNDSMLERWTKRNIEVEKARNTVSLIDDYVYTMTHGKLPQKNASVIGEGQEPYVLNLPIHTDEPFEALQALLEASGERQLMHEVEMEVDRSRSWTKYINEDPSGLSREVHLEFNHRGLCRNNPSCAICAHPRAEQQKVASITLGNNPSSRRTRTMDAGQYKPKYQQ